MDNINSKIPYGKQSIAQADIDAVVEVLKSSHLTQGPRIEQFEQAISNYCGVKHTKVVCNGTAALHLAYLAVGLKSGDLVWTSPNSFVATANAALFCGAKVDFVDINPKTYNMSVECLEQKLIQAQKDNKLPDLVVPVHFAGQSCEMEKIWQLSQQYNFKIVEDACHALGGEYQGKKVGCCQYSHAAVFSFHPVKMITSGEGGAIVTNDKEMDYKIEVLRSHGIAKDDNKFQKIPDGGWYYEQQALGFNYRLTDIQAVLGISQLKRLDEFVARRREIADTYNKELKNVVLPYQHPDTNSSWHLYVIQVENRKEVYDLLKANNIYVQIHYYPINQQLFYNREPLNNVRNYYNNCISLPIYFQLENNKLLEIVKKFVK